MPARGPAAALRQKPVPQHRQKLLLTCFHCLFSLLYIEFLCLLLFRQPQPRGLHVLTLGERGLGRAGVGAVVVGDSETERALSAGGQQGDIDFCGTAGGYGKRRSDVRA